jgi:hypothetical protein
MSAQAKDFFDSLASKKGICAQQANVRYEFFRLAELFGALFTRCYSLEGRPVYSKVIQVFI